MTKEPFVRDNTMFVMAAFLNLEDLIRQIKKAKDGHKDFIRGYLQHMDDTRFPTP